MSHDAHDDHGAAHPAPAPPEPKGPPPPHVLTIARGTRGIGLLLWALGFAATLYYFAVGPWSCIAWSAFASLYGFAIWLAARDTLADGAGA